MINGDENAARRVPARVTAEGMIIAVRLTPKAPRDEIGGLKIEAGGEMTLTARVRAPADRGRANAALEALLAAWLDVAKSDCSLIAGGKSRQKRILVRGHPEALMARLAQRVANLETGD